MVHLEMITSSNSGSGGSGRSIILNFILVAKLVGSHDVTMQRHIRMGKKGQTNHIKESTRKDFISDSSIYKRFQS